MKVLLQVRNFFAHHPNARYEDDYVFPRMQKVSSQVLEITEAHFLNDELLGTLKMLATNQEEAKKPENALIVMSQALSVINLNALFRIHEIKRVQPLETTQAGLDQLDELFDRCSPSARNSPLFDAGKS